MSRSYSLCGSVTTPNSATLPIANILATAAVRPKIYDIILGASSAAADSTGRFLVQRCSTAGTPGTNPTPSPLDPADPASLTTAGLAVFSVGPTLGASMLGWGLNQRATFRWIAAPKKELVAPATANNGFALMNPATNGGTYTVDFTIEFEE